jgi:dTMP kinase
MSVKNLFIAFEGIDGSGKSTQVKLLAEFLAHKGHKVYTTFEPTDSRIGVMIRDIFNHRMEGDQRVIAALFAADRLNHLLNSQDGILKKLKEGYTVITDRYYFSSYAYHSVHNIDMDWVIQANSMSADLLRPDLNIYIDISPDVSMERLKKGRNSFEMYETLENQKMVYDKYKEAFDRLGDAEKVFVTDGNRKTDLIAEDIRIAVEALIGPGNN